MLFFQEDCAIAYHRQNCSMLVLFTDKVFYNLTCVNYIIIRNKYIENGSSQLNICLFSLPFPIFCLIKLNIQKYFAIIKLFNYVLYCFKIIKVLHVLNLKAKLQLLQLKNRGQ